MFAASEGEMRRNCHAYLRSFAEAEVTPEGKFSFL